MATIPDNIPASQLLGNATESNGLPLTPQIQGQPAGASLVQNADGSFTFTQSSAGANTISYLIKAESGLTGGDQAANDVAGVSVAVNNGTAIVGVPQLNPQSLESGTEMPTGPGKAFVFVSSAGVWTLQATLTDPNKVTGDAFGLSVAILGGTAVVGAPGTAVSGNVGQGEAYVFTRTGTTWKQQGSGLTDSAGAAYDELGFSAALTTTTTGSFGVVLGAPQLDLVSPLDSLPGKAVVFTGTTPGSLSKTTTLIAIDGVSRDVFGHSVAVAPDTSGGIVVLAGAPNALATAGAAYIFSGSPLLQSAKLTDPAGAIGDFFGASVSLDSDGGGTYTAAVGAPQSLDSISTTGPGKALVFTNSGGTWNQQATVTAADGATGDEFGTSVNVSGNTLVVGAPQFNGSSPANSGVGKVYQFTRSGTNWSQTAFYTPNGGAIGDAFGTSVMLDSAAGNFVVGSPTSNNTAGGALVEEPGVVVNADVQVLGAPSKVLATAGDGQSVQVGNAFPTDLQVTVEDASDDPLPGVSVTFTAPASGPGGTFPGGTAITVTTNSSGVATAPVFTANSTAGSYNVTASVSGVSPPTDFGLTNNPGPPASITTVGGTAQSATVNDAFAAPLQAVVEDALGNPIAGAMVTFTAPGSGASGTFSNGSASITVATNASGVASTSFTANTVAGAMTVTASVAGATGASFALTNTAGPPASIDVASGSGQTAGVGSTYADALTVSVVDQFGNPVAGASVTFTSADGPGATFPGGVLTAVVSTDANGIATAPTLTANTTAGAFDVTATVGGVALPATFSLTNVALPSAGFDELGAYRPSNGSWSLDSNRQFGFQTGGPEGQAPLADRVISSFSPAGANVVPVSGDWVGSGTSEIGDFEASTWHLDLNNNGKVDPGETFSFGTAGDVPVPGQYLPGGGIELAVWRSFPAQGFGEFFISDANWLAEGQAGQSIGIATSFIFGAAGDRVVVGDWNGAGLTEVGVFRSAAAFGAPNAAVFSLDVANHHTFDGTTKIFIFGTFTDGVVVGDWDGSGTSKVGVYRAATAFNAPNTAVFSLDEHGDLDFTKDGQVFLFGLPTDRYVTGDWAFTTSSGGGSRLPGAAADNADVAAALLTAPMRSNVTGLDAFFSQA